MRDEFEGKEAASRVQLCLQLSHKNWLPVQSKILSCSPIWIQRLFPLGKANKETVAIQILNEWNTLLMIHQFQVISSQILLWEVHQLDLQIDTQDQHFMSKPWWLRSNFLSKLLKSESKILHPRPQTCLWNGCFMQKKSNGHFSNIEIKWSDCFTVFTMVKEKKSIYHGLFCAWAVVIALGRALMQELDCHPALPRCSNVVSPMLKKPLNH